MDKQTNRQIYKINIFILKKSKGNSFNYNKGKLSVGAKKLTNKQKERQTDRKTDKDNKTTTKTMSLSQKLTIDEI